MRQPNRMNDGGDMGSSLTPQLRGWGKEVVQRIKKSISLYNLENRTPTLVYQMGKVGSSTVMRTLEGLHSPDPVIRVHSLNPAKVSKDIDRLRANLGYLDEHVITSLTLVRKGVDWGEFPCNVITLTREPVGRAISFAFQDWRQQLPEVSDLNELQTERMVERVLEKLQEESEHSDPGRWFERELESVFDIDVMAVPYDFDQGYVKIQKDPAEVLVIRMEDLNHSLRAGLADLHGLEPRDIQMRQSNIGRNKKYAELLAEVKERLTLPSSLTERIWGTDYAEHFYGPDLDHLRKKWGGET